jgi:hypothetical protein
MKSIGPAFHDLDFVVDSLKTLRTDGIATVIDNAIGVPNENPCKPDDRAFTGYISFLPPLSIPCTV